MIEFVVTRVMDVADDSVHLTIPAALMSPDAVIRAVQKAHKWTACPKATVELLGPDGEVEIRLLIECIDPPAVDVWEGIECPEVNP